MADDEKKVHSKFWANIFNPPTETDELVNSLQVIPLFKSLTKKDISLLMSIVHNRNYLTDEYIFYQNDPGIGLYIIREGEVVISREDDEGDKVTLAVFQKGDFFGELAMVDDDKRSASAIAKTEAKVSVIFKSDLDEFIEKYPKKGIKILKGIAEITALRLRILNEEYFYLRKEKILEDKNGT